LFEMQVEPLLSANAVVDPDEVPVRMAGGVFILVGLPLQDFDDDTGLCCKDRISQLCGEIYSCVTASPGGTVVGTG
jgi:hypothetical protein